MRAGPSPNIFFAGLDDSACRSEDDVPINNLFDDRCLDAVVGQAAGAARLKLQGLNRHRLGVALAV